MSSIAICNLKTAGFELFSDSESYLKDLNITEQNVQGGIWNAAPYALIFLGAAGIGGYISHKAIEHELWKDGV